MSSENSIDFIIEEIVDINFREFIERTISISVDFSENANKRKYAARKRLCDELCSLYLKYLTKDEIIYLHNYLCSDEGKAITKAQIEISKQLPELLSKI